MLTEIIEYQCGQQTCRGYLAKPADAQAATPAIVVAHAWRGQDDFSRQKAEALAGLGYIGFAADLYGNGKTATTDEEAFQLMLPLFLDRQLLRARIISAVDTVKSNPLVDAAAVGAIGFCFGGLTVIELLRSGTDIAGAVSFHGLLGTELGEYKAKPLPIAKGIKGSLLILHGHDDPLVSKADIDTAQQELTQAKVDWQMNIYGHAAHAFTNPQAKDVASGLVFNARADRRSWEAMRAFFNDVFA